MRNTSGTRNSDLSAFVDSVEFVEDAPPRFGVQDGWIVIAYEFRDVFAACGRVCF